MTTRTMVLALLAAAAPAAAQDLRSRIEGAPNGTVRLSFAAKPGVCGNGRNISTGRHGQKDGWEHDCESGPVRVAVDVDNGRVGAVRTYVGGRWRHVDSGEITDLGMVSAPAASAFFLALAEREDRVKGDLVLPAILADSAEAWPALLRIAKNDKVRNETRKHAVFWLSQEASDAATRGLTDIVNDDDDDREVRKQAVFALSQLPHDRGVPALIEVARTNKDREVRKSAIFWLGQSEDPRAIQLFEELLTKRQ
jgi:hypothetical protein